jgi:hypothetical protein
MTKITRKQQVANIIEWINRLPNFKKTVNQLGWSEVTLSNKVDWKYCCLGVACRVQKLPHITFSAGTEPALIDTLCLRSQNAIFDKKVTVKLPNVTGQPTTIGSLVGSNDSVFRNDTGFARQRAFMILTTNRWIKSEEVAAQVNKHFAKEREELKRNPLFKLEIKK